jgi:hypothetical protein
MARLTQQYIYFGNISIMVDPTWFKGARRKEERSEVRTAFENMEKYLLNVEICN